MSPLFKRDEPASEATLAPAQYVRISFADGQETQIEVDYSSSVQILDAYGAVVATVALSGVEDIEVKL